jgi:formate dehydrogenase beta subunit
MMEYPAAHFLNIRSEGKMNEPIVNTWQGPDKFSDLSKHAVARHFSGHPFKAVAGWEGVIVWDEAVDPVDLLNAYILQAYKESCGQCAPCRLGTARMMALSTKICEGKGAAGDLDTLRFLASQISISARCDIGRTLGKPVLDILDTYKSSFLEVIQGKRNVRPGKYKSVVTAPCVSACPSRVDIPSYLENIRLNRFDEAMAVVRKDCPMPGTIGRVCVRPCEANCRRAKLDEPLSIRALKRFLADQEMFAGMAPDTSTPETRPEKIAVIGAGPAGLSCAYYLGKQGYKTTVFESQEGPGGMAAYGIPSYRLPREVIAHETEVVKQLGAEIQYGVTVGEKPSLEDLANQGFKAIFIGVGAPESSKMRCEGEDAGYKCFMTGVYFLAEAARNRKPLEGNKIVVIGGGNVAMDCVRTARRLGFTDVNLLYRRTGAEMPADPLEIKEAKEEGVVFQYLVAPVQVIAKDGKVSGLKCQRMELGDPDAGGRRSPVPVKGSEFVIDCDAIIPAVGQICVVDCVLPEEDESVVTKWKTLVVDQTTFQSDKKNVFGGGDCVTGPKTLIAALAAGKNAARFISQYLGQGRCSPDETDVLQAIVASKGMFEHDEPFAYPGGTERTEARVLPPESRVTNFDEVEGGLSAAQAREEASRCLRCYRILTAAL